MIIDNSLLDEVSEKAKASERLRMNFNLHDSLDAKAQRLLNALEIGTIPQKLIFFFEEKFV